MPVVEATVELIKKEILDIDAKIADVERKKLITLVEPGGPDKVLFVQPLDLGDKDPEGYVDEEKSELVETKFDQGYAQHFSKKVKTGRRLKRFQLDAIKWTGPFGPTRKIDTGIQDGEREWASLKRVLETHVSRFTQVPEPLPYHRDVDERGVLDLRNISITKEDVPVAQLENYAPLEALRIERKRALARLSDAMGTPMPPDSDNPEDGAMRRAGAFSCPHCPYVGPSEKGLGLHMTKTHTGGEDAA